MIKETKLSGCLRSTRLAVVSLLTLWNDKLVWLLVGFELRADDVV